jgi:hypothetical protein
VSRAALIALCAAACGTPRAPSGVGRVRIVLSGIPDTIRFEVPAVATKCAEGSGLLIHGEQRGQGFLVWLRGGSSPDTGTYPLLTRGDTVAVRGALASLRYMIGDVAHGFALDDGTATLTRATPPLALELRGLGVEAASAGQRRAVVSLEQVALHPDTVSCRVLQ